MFVSSKYVPQEAKLIEFATSKLTRGLRLTSFKNGPRFGNHDLAKVWGKIAQARSRVDSDSCLGTSRGKASLISGKTHRQKLLHEKLASV